MSWSNEIRLSSLEEPVIEAILQQLENRELRILARKYLGGQDSDVLVMARLLSLNLEFTLTTKVILNYDQY